MGEGEGRGEGDGERWSRGDMKWVTAAAVVVRSNGWRLKRTKEEDSISIERRACDVKPCR